MTGIGQVRNERQHECKSQCICIYIYIFNKYLYMHTKKYIHIICSLCNVCISTAEIVTYCTMNIHQAYIESLMYGWLSHLMLRKPRRRPKRRVSEKERNPRCARTTQGFEYVTVYYMFSQNMSTEHHLVSFNHFCFKQQSN